VPYSRPRTEWPLFPHHNRYNYRNSIERQEELQTARQSVSIRKDLQTLGDSCKHPKEICKQSVGIQSTLQTTVRSEKEYWKDSYNPVVVAGHVDRPEYWLFRPALLKGFGPDCWKDSYNPVIVAGHVDRPEYWLFRPAPLRGFGPVCRTVTLVNTSTVTIILRYRIFLLTQTVEQ
jgi:hypothetical protein